MTKSDREKAANAVAVSRIVVGSSAWLTPNLAGRMFGLDPDNNPQLPYVGRLFGARDVALGAGLLRASRKRKQPWMAAAVACDVADTAAGVLAGARGQLPPGAAALVTATAGAFAAAGIWLLHQ